MYYDMIKFKSQGFNVTSLWHVCDICVTMKGAQNWVYDVFMKNRYYGISELLNAIQAMRGLKY